MLFQETLLVVGQISKLFLHSKTFLLQKSHLLDQILSHDTFSLGLIILIQMVFTLTRVALLLFRRSR